MPTISLLSFNIYGSGDNVQVITSGTDVYVGFTGSGIDSITSGDLTGIFYPRYANPKGYINQGWLAGFCTSGNLTDSSGVLQSQINFINDRTGDLANNIDTGIFVNKSDTGNFITDDELITFHNDILTQVSSLSNWTGSSTSIFYPLTDNPAGYLSNLNGTGVLSNVFYPLNNPAGYITGMDTSNFALKSQTGNFVINSQLSSYALKNDTGNFVTSNQITNFVSNSQTGAFANKSYVDLVSGNLAAQISTGNHSSGTLVKITGSNDQSSINVVGLGSAKVSLSGSTVLISGSTAPVQTSGSVTIVGGSTIANGQILIGQASDNSLTLGNLVAGSGISITSGAASLTINSIPSQQTQSNPYFYNIITKGSNFTLGSGDFTVIHTGNSAATFTIPSAIGISGRLWIIKNASSANTTVTSTSQIYTTGLSTSVTFNSGDALSFHSNGNLYYAH